MKFVCWDCSITRENGVVIFFVDSSSFLIAPHRNITTVVSCDTNVSPYGSNFESTVGVYLF
jgi:hypothetical protein